MTPPIYNEIYDHILEILEQYNFYTAPQSKNPKDAIDFITNIRKTNLKAQLSGIDLSKKNLSSVFKVPATLYGNEENRFFYESYLGLNRDFPRHVVNVSKIIKSRLAKLKTIANYETDYDLIVEPISYNDGLKVVDSIQPMHINSEIGEPNTIEPISDIKETNPTLKDLNNKTIRFNGYKNRIIEQINKEVKPGNRSYNACRFAGTIKHWSNHQDKLDILNLLASKGCDKSAMKSAYHYAGLT